jgi:hypothetical protein
MPSTEPSSSTLHVAKNRDCAADHLESPRFAVPQATRSASEHHSSGGDPVLTVDDVARRLNVSKDLVWDHSVVLWTSVARKGLR